MNRVTVIWSLLCCLSMASLLTGCFTGIESTPRITATDVRKENIRTETPEQSLSRTLISDSLSRWKSGRQFVVVDSRIKLLFNSTNDNSLPSVGDTIQFSCITPVPSLMGDTMSLLKFITSDDNADTLIYRIESRPDDLINRQTVTVPFVIDQEFVRKIDSMLKGQTLYPITSTRYNRNGERIVSRKFIPVTVTGVTSGNADFPLRVNFTEADDKNVYYVFMSGGTGKMSTRNFDSLFSLSDPRLSYPAITDENWEAITRGKVRPDMTRDECRLSLGSPADVMYGHSYSSTYERWTYTNGVMLEFEDGLLKAFRL